MIILARSARSFQGFSTIDVFVRVDPVVQEERLAQHLCGHSPLRSSNVAPQDPHRGLRRRSQVPIDDISGARQVQHMFLALQEAQ